MEFYSPANQVAIQLIPYDKQGIFVRMQFYQNGRFVTEVVLPLDKWYTLLQDMESLLPQIEKLLKEMFS